MVPPTEPCALRSTQPLRVSTRDFSRGKRGRCVWLTTYHPCGAETSRKSGALSYPEPQGPPRPVAGDLYFTGSIVGAGNKELFPSYYLGSSNGSITWNGPCITIWNHMSSHHSHTPLWQDIYTMTPVHLKYTNWLDYFRVHCLWVAGYQRKKKAHSVLQKTWLHLMYVWPCIIYENDETYQLDATIMIYHHK